MQKGAGKSGPKISGLLAIMGLVLVSLPLTVWPAFYQATTMADYCREYMRMVELKNPVNQLEAGICSGYIASKIEIMDLSEQLCQRDKINLNDVVQAYIEHVESNSHAGEHTATYSVVELLQEKYACNSGS